MITGAQTAGGVDASVGMRYFGVLALLRGAKTARLVTAKATPMPLKGKNGFKRIYASYGAPLYLQGTHQYVEVEITAQLSRADQPSKENL